MGLFSITHWIVVILILTGIILPVVRILRRLGLSGWWAVLAFLPLGNLAGLIALSLVRWPAERGWTAPAKAGS